MRLTQKDLANYLGVTRASLSEATKKGHRCKGYQVRAWAVYDGAGRVAGYDVPDHVMERGQPEEDTSPEEPAQTALTTQSSAQTALTTQEPTLSSIMWANPAVPTPRVDDSTRISLLPEGEDYARTASAGGAAYVIGEAIGEDNATAHGALVVTGGGIGATIGGMAASQDEDASTALCAFVGGLLGVGAGCIGIAIQSGQGPG